METADMVVMGAGVMGTSIAFHLAERRAERVVLCLSLGLVLALSAGACRNRTDGTVQYPDDSFVVPDGGEPRYARDQGPTVGIDEAHRNYHTADDRYRSFANLLRDDGYRVGRFAETFTRDALGNIDVLVISNALSAEKDKEWSLPTPPAFTEEEVDVVEGWVREGGRLMLIADHMPFPGAAANLAMAFGVVFHDSYAYSPTSYDDGESLLTFSKEEGLLADHSVTQCRRRWRGPVRDDLHGSGVPHPSTRAGVPPSSSSGRFLPTAPDASVRFRRERSTNSRGRASSRCLDQTPGWTRRCLWRSCGLFRPDPGAGNGPVPFRHEQPCLSAQRAVSTERYGLANGRRTPVGVSGREGHSEASLEGTLAV